MRLQFDMSPPWHPYQERFLPPDATMQVTSGGLRFGFQNDIDFSETRPLLSDKEQTFAHHACFSGPVINNIRARNGVWNGYKIATRTWFPQLTLDPPSPHT